MYRVIEVADILGVSKVTVYKKIEELKPEIMSAIKIEDGVTFVDNIGVKLIKKSLKRSVTSKPKDKAELKLIDVKVELDLLSKENEKLLASNRDIIKKQEEDILLNYRYLSTIANGKREEVRKLKEVVAVLRAQIEQANWLISTMK